MCFVSNKRRQMSVRNRLPNWIKWSGGFLVYHLPFCSGLRSRYLARLYRASEHQGWLFFSFRSYVLGRIAYRDVRQFRQEVFAGAAGAGWSDFYRSQDADFYLREFREPLSACRAILQQGEFQRFLQVGCAGGRELSILAAEFPRIRFRGVDLSSDAVVTNRQAYQSLANLDFQVADLTVPASWTAWEPEVIYSSGCLEYLEEREVIAFFGAVRDCKGRCILLFEPTDNLGGSRSRSRGGGAFAHDYPCLLRDQGWNQIELIPESTAGGRVLLRATR